MGEKKKPPYKLFILVLALLLIVAYYISGVFKDHRGIEQFEERLLKVLMNPLQNYFHPKITPVAFFIAIILWLFFISRYLIYNRNFLPDKEFGSAQWANPVKAAKKLQAPNQEDNRILSENVRVNLYGNAQAGTGLSNNNVLLVGSPGTGKTMFELTPNILLASRSMVFLDVKGEILRKYGNYLKKKGYVVRVLNLKEFQYSNGYNPFAYITEEADIPRLIRNILSAIDPPEAQKLSLIHILLLCPKYLERIGEIIGGNYFVVPSSIHEILIVPEKGEIPVNIHDFHDIINTVNQNNVALEEQLGDYLQRYDSEKKLLVSTGTQKPVYPLLQEEKGKTPEKSIHKSPRL